MTSSTSTVSHTDHGNTHAHIPQWAVLAIACAAQFMVVLDVSIVNVALPSIQGELHMTQSQLQWVVDAYALTFAGFLLFGGRAGDFFGRKRIFLLGLAIFTLASLSGGFARNSLMLEISRAVQGLGGGLLAPSTLSLLTTTYTEPRARARALGVWSAMAGSGGAFGAMAGGIITENLSWRWVLYVNVPIGALLFAAAAIALRESRGPVRTIRGLDIPGTLTVTSGLAVLVYGIVSTRTHPWGSAFTLTTLAIALALLVTFVLIETRTSMPVVPLRIFRMRALSAANGIAVVVGATMFSMFFFLSLYLQHIVGYRPMPTGFAFLPGALVLIGGATIASKLVSRIGPRRLLLVGGALNVAALWWLSRLPASGGYASHVLAPLMLVCLGMGLSMVPLTVAATTGVARSEAGLASGLLNTTRQVGGALGLAALTTVATAHAAAVAKGGTGPIAAETAGYDRAFVVATFVALAGTLLALALPGRAAHVATIDEASAEHARSTERAHEPAEVAMAEPAIEH